MSEMNRRPHLATCLSALLVLCALPSIGLAQGPWDVPEGSAGNTVGPPHEFPSLTVFATVVGPINFSEPEFPPDTVVDGLVVGSLNGNPLPGPLSFGFTVGGVPSIDSTITGGPPTQMFVDPPGIEGDVDGTLTIDFGIDVSSVEFGFTLACVPPDVSPGTTVTAFDAGMSVVGVLSVDAIDTGNLFVENLLQFAPGTFRSIEATWNAACSRFFLDNLAYEETSFIFGDGFESGDTSAWPAAVL